MKRSLALNLGLVAGCRAGLIAFGARAQQQEVPMVVPRLAAG
jgi:hypothetical protein